MNIDHLPAFAQFLADEFSILDAVRLAHRTLSAAAAGDSRTTARRLLTAVSDACPLKKTQQQEMHASADQSPRDCSQDSPHLLFLQTYLRLCLVDAEDTAAAVRLLTSMRTSLAYFSPAETYRIMHAVMAMTFCKAHRQSPAVVAAAVCCFPSSVSQSSLRLATLRASLALFVEPGASETDDFDETLAAELAALAAAEEAADCPLMQLPSELLSEIFQWGGHETAANVTSCSRRLLDIVLPPNSRFSSSESRAIWEAFFASEFGRIQWSSSSASSSSAFSGSTAPGSKNFYAQFKQAWTARGALAEILSQHESDQRSLGSSISQEQQRQALLLEARLQARRRQPHPRTLQASDRGSP